MPDQSSLLSRLRRPVVTPGIAHAIEQGLHEEGRRRADALEAQLDYVRHVAESARATAAMVARRKVPGRRVTVLFLVHHPEAWYSLARVHELMLADPDFEVVVASLPRHFPGADGYRDEDYVSGRLDHFGVEHLRFNSRDPFMDLDIIRTIDPDIIVRQSQWDADIPPAFATSELRFARLCQVPYELLNFIVNIIEDSGLNTVLDSPFHRNAWAVFCANDEVRAEIAEQTPATRARQFVATGHPKADVLGALAGAEPDPGHRFTVLWSAHHSVGEEWIRFGTFATTGPQMVEQARAHPEWDFVFSAHPALLTKMDEHAAPLSEALVADFWRDWNALPNTSVFGGGDYADQFRNSDVLVCDGVSWLAEYQLTGRPVVFLEREGHQPFSPLGERIIAGVNRVPGVAEAFTLVEALAAGAADPRQDERQRTAQLLRGDGHAAENIVAAIKAKLEDEGWQH